MTKDAPLTGKQIQLFPTELCDLKCSDCPYPGIPPIKRKHMKQQERPPSEWVDIFDYSYSEGGRLFMGMGGEPASYNGIEIIPARVSQTPDAIFILSTSGFHMVKDPDKFRRIGEALVSGNGRRVRNGLTISFDAIPTNHPQDSREFKAAKGIELADKIRKTFGEEIILTANVMVTPDNVRNILNYQTFLENHGVATNLCTRQSRCFGEDPTFQPGDEALTSLSIEMLRRRKEGRTVVNSAGYLSQLPGIIGPEDYQCWTEPQGSPVIDVAPNGSFRECNWPRFNHGDYSQFSWNLLASGKMSWEDFWGQSKKATQANCGGCSWSRRDRNIEPMVEPNLEITRRAGIDDHEVPKLQNLFVAEQLKAR